MSSSLTSALSLALTGLRTTTGLITLASNNISNAQTDGYTSKTASVTTVENGQDFGGSTIASYSRATDAALTNNLNTATTTASYLSTQQGYMSQLQATLDSTSNNPTLSSDVAAFSAAWSEYSSAPESNIQQQNVINTGEQLANDINAITGNVASLKAQVGTDIGTAVTTLNSALKQIASLNSQIQTAFISKQPTVDLEDQRDHVVNQIASYMNVTTQNRANGQVAVYTPAGQLLVDGITPLQFTYSGGVVSDPNGSNMNSVLTGGSLQAMTDFISTTAAATASTTPGVGTIAKMQSQLSKFVDSLTNSSGSTPSAFATAYTSAVTASTASGASQNGVNVAASFFSVLNSGGIPDPSSFQVTSTLLNGTYQLPKTGAQGVASSFNATATYTASGLTATSVTYAQLATGILSNFQQAANTITNQSTTATSQQNFYKQTLTNKTGVNVDTELANLVAYQSSYAASAHVITTVNQMLSTLMSIIS